MDISIIVPLYNEKESLKVLYNQIVGIFESLGREFEMIYIDDGSTDGSFSILKELSLKDKRVKVIAFDKNYGQTSAFDAGFHIAKGKYILVLDADLQYDPKDLVRILDGLNNYDVVVGYRVNRKEADGYIKYLSSKIANYFRRKVLKEGFIDAGCFLRGYRKECISKLILYKGFNVFIISLLGMSGCRVKEIEVKVYPRRYGYSKYNIRNRLIKELLALFVVNWMKRNRCDYKINYTSC